MSKSISSSDNAGALKVTLLDVGKKKYGDAVLCQFGSVSVLIDGAHPNDDDLIIEQLRELLNQEPPFQISLLIVTHPHDDHIGCLTRLVANQKIKPKWALVADPQYRWGEGDETDNRLLGLGFRARGLMEALREENRSDLSDQELTEFMDSVATVRERYTEMIQSLTQQGTKVVRHGTDDASALKAAFANIGLNIVGPTLNHLQECRRLLQENEQDSLASIESLFLSDSAVDVAGVYRGVMNNAMDFFRPNKGAINLQSIVTIFEYAAQKVLFAGDMQFADPEVQSPFLENSMRELQDQIEQEAPFTFYKISHHGSHNAFSEEVIQRLGGSALFGICGGVRDRDHPDQDVLQLLDNHSEDIQWVRTDHNGQTTIVLTQSGPDIAISRGEINDASPNTGEGDNVRDAAAHSAVTVRSEPTADSDGRGPTGTVEISARVPSNARHVSITVNMEPLGG